MNANLKQLLQTAKEKYPTGSYYKTGNQAEKVLGEIKWNKSQTMIKCACLGWLYNLELNEWAEKIE